MPNIFELHDKVTPRLSPSLADEIGLIESTLLLQFEFWISNKGHERDDKLWTYRSLKQIRRVFPFWSRSTIARAIINLQELELLHVTAKYNQRANDKTRWFALNLKGCSELKSLTLCQNETDLSQNETTLPKEYNKEEIKELAQADIREDVDSVVDNWSLGIEQPYLINIEKPKRKKPLRFEPIEKVSHKVMYRICYAVETDRESSTLSSTQRGKVASILGRLTDAGADLNMLPQFDKWWKSSWRSKDRDGTYQPPRPEQVIEFWWVAMRATQKEETQHQPQQQTTSVVVDFEERMRQRAIERRENIG